MECENCKNHIEYWDEIDGAKHFDGCYCELMEEGIKNHDLCCDNEKDVESNVKCKYKKDR